MQLCIQRDANVDTTDNNGRTPLILAAKENHADVCERLIEFNADLNILEAVNSRRAIHYAFASPSTRIAKSLIAEGAILPLPSENARPSLLEISLDGAVECTILALELCDVNALNRSNTSALYVAASRNQPERVQLLLTAGASLEPVGGVSVLEVLNNPDQTVFFNDVVASISAYRAHQAIHSIAKSSSTAASTPTP